MAEKSSSAVAQAISAINSLNLVIKKHTNTSNEVKSSLKECTDSILNIIKSQSMLINELKAKNEEQRDNNTTDGRFLALENLNKQIFGELKEIKSQMSTKSYASTLTGCNSTEKQSFASKSNKNLVIIKPKVETTNAKQTQHVIKTALDSKHKRGGVENVKTISKGGIILECKSQEMAEDIIHIINSDLRNDFRAEKPVLKKPKIIVFGVDSDVNNETIINEIIESNREISDYLEVETPEEIKQELSLRFKYRRKIVESQSTENNRRVESTDKYVLEVSPEMRKIIFNLRSIKIGWRSHRFADYLPVVRCHKCNNFGHFQKDCRSTQACGHCAGQHNSRDCKVNKSEHKCINCCRFNDNNKSGRRVNINHSSFSEMCGSFKRIVNLVKDKISYE